MLQALLEHLAFNWGNWASVVGLVFSALAFWFSKRASEAAEQARDSVLRRSCGDDLEDARRIATEISRFVGMGKSEMARLRSEDLHSTTTYLAARWGREVSEKSKRNLLRAGERLAEIQRDLDENSIADMPAAKRQTLNHACRAVKAIFDEECGNARGAIDREV